MSNFVHNRFSQSKIYCRTFTPPLLNIFPHRPRLGKTFFTNIFLCLEHSKCDLLYLFMRTLICNKNNTCTQIYIHFIFSYVYVSIRKYIRNNIMFSDNCYPNLEHRSLLGIYNRIFDTFVLRRFIGYRNDRCSFIYIFLLVQLL